MKLGVVLLACAACSGGDTTIHTGSGGGKGGESGASGGSAGFGGSGGSAGSGTGGGDNTSGCSDDAKTVYVVAQDRTFSAFDPRTKTFRDIGVLNCPAGPGAQPFSMAVARDATAYVLYDDSELFKVSTSNLACTTTSFSPTLAYALFGMGFSTDTVGGTADTLFIAGGLGVGTTSKLGNLDVSAFGTTPLVDIPGWPELTGTGDAQLWGFFPDTGNGTAPFVARIDKMTGVLSSNYPAMDLAGSADGWAFAFWGGSFWIFLKRQTDTSTKVYEMKADTGALTAVVMSTGRNIVGAGVSTCAPITIN
jgi:hypothetical protein